MPPRLQTCERGDAAVGYLFVVATMIAIAIAIVGLERPIERASDLAVGLLADNNP